jgi:holo-[acyl-carrier-protein] synthase
MGMIVGSGIDIAEVLRIAEAIQRHGQRFLHRVFTEGEIAYCDSKANRIERYAARFAAKEAGMKALGTGWNHGVRWRDVEVCRSGDSGKLSDYLVIPTRHEVPRRNLLWPTQSRSCPGVADSSLSLRPWSE